jgi:phosphonate transport system permease protein
MAPGSSLGQTVGSNDDAVVLAFETRWRRALLATRLKQLIAIVVVSTLLVVSFHASGFFSTQLGNNPFARIGDFLGRLLPPLAFEALLEPRGTQGSLASWFYDPVGWLTLLWETFQIALLATIFGTAGGLLLSFLGAQNLAPNGVIYWITRRSMDIIRTLPDLIVALILVAAFGIGPLPGVIALSIGTAASLGKLFSEANENIDMRQVEAVRATGAGWFKQMRFGVLPQVMANHLSYALLRLELNVGGAAALGIVGAGGIGMELARAITYTEFDTWLALLLLIVVLIVAIDMLSEVIRHRIIGAERFS